jgi:dihydroorotate dehydrogenase
MTLSSFDYSSRSQPGSTLGHFPISSWNLQRSSALRRIHRLFQNLGRHVLLHLPPEYANYVALKLLPITQRVFPVSVSDDGRLGIHLFGLSFRNPIGSAPGLNKNAEAVSALLSDGFGFAEVGTVTPLPQSGNPKPRVFRLPKDQAIINRFGFNSDGEEIVFERLTRRADEGGIVGVNIGPNKDSPDRISDYLRLIERLAPVASYITINISSPNTPGLRDLQSPSALGDLLARVMEARAGAARNGNHTPVLVKIAPDLSLCELDDIVGVACALRIDGMIVGNTTVMRPSSLRETKKAKQVGGLSGRPLFSLSTRILAETFVRVERKFPLIGTGGIDSGATALAKFRAGASLVQLCSGFVFRGPDLIDEIKAALIVTLERDRLDSVAALVGIDAAAVSAEPWPQ